MDMEDKKRCHFYSRSNVDWVKMRATNLRRRPSTIGGILRHDHTSPNANRGSLKLLRRYSEKTLAEHTNDAIRIQQEGYTDMVILDPPLAEET